MKWYGGGLVYRWTSTEKLFAKTECLYIINDKTLRGPMTLEGPGPYKDPGPYEDPESCSDQDPTRTQDPIGTQNPIRIQDPRPTQAFWGPRTLRGFRIFWWPRKDPETYKLTKVSWFPHRVFNLVEFTIKSRFVYYCWMQACLHDANKVGLYFVLKKK